MANRSAAARDDYWKKRLASPAFRRTLSAAIAAELRAVGRLRVGQMLDPRIVRDVIRHWDVRVADQAALAEVVIAANRRGGRRLAAHRESLVDLLDPTFVAELERVIDAGLELTGRGRGFLTALIEREFVRGLFTDLIFTALVAFQRRANPLFGGLAVRALEDQIKRFIGLFMPMLQKQAVAFALDRANQRAVLRPHPRRRPPPARDADRELRGGSGRRGRRLVRGAAARGRDQSAPHRSRPARAPGRLGRRLRQREEPADR